MKVVVIKAADVSDCLQTWITKTSFKAFTLIQLNCFVAQTRGTKD